MSTARIYRHGALTTSTYTGEIAEYSTRADEVRPAGRPGRNGSLYASPTISGVGRWVHGILGAYGSRAEDVETYELTVDPDSLYVYSVEAWERYSWSMRPTDPADYWATGMTLTEWLATDGLDPREWEVLFSPEDIKSSRRVSAKRLLTHDAGRTYQLEDTLKQFRIR